MKLGKLVIYGKVNAPMNSHVLLATGSHEVTRRTKSKIFLRPGDVSPPNVAGC